MSGTFQKRLVNVGLWACVVVFNTTNQVCLKFASAILKDYSFGLGWFMAAAHNPYIWVSLVAEIIGFLAWLVILKTQDLSVAFPVSSMVYMAIIAASTLIFHEQTYMLQFIGMLFILLGILLMGRFTSSKESTQ
jgi:drug/metabolite transporter (DMT)-like permease